MSSISTHIGSRIRMYRKALGMTISDLSAMVYKSKSTISKYENGEVSIDVETHFDIAAALKVSINQLTDCQKPSATEGRSNNLLGFFNKLGCYYIYYYDGILKQVVRCVLELMPVEKDSPCSAVLYLGLKDYDNVYSCYSLFYGEASYSDARTIFILQNQTNRTEKLYLNVITPLSTSTQTFGVLSGISMHYFVPVTYKALFSYSPLKDEDIPIERLKFSKEDIKLIKKHNAMLIINDPINS